MSDELNLNNDNLFIPTSPGEYKLPEQKEVLVDDKGQVIEKKDLTPWNYIQLAAQKMNVEIKKPRSSCKHCHGRGYEGFRPDTHEPVVCSCVIIKKKEDNKPFIPINRNTKRKYAKYMTKTIIDNYKKGKYNDLITSGVENG